MSKEKNTHRNSDSELDSLFARAKSDYDNEFELTTEDIETDLSKIWQNIDKSNMPIHLFPKYAYWVAAAVVIFGFLGWVRLETRELIHQNTSSFPAQFTLNNGVEVDLAPNTTIIYSGWKWNKNSNVFLSGMATFDVPPQKELFNVRSENAQIAVLGTHFTVLSPTKLDKKARQSTSIQLHEGEISVKIEGMDSNEQMKGGESLWIQNGHISRGIASETPNWNASRFSFQNEPLKLILNELSLWYDVEITLGDNLDTERKITFVRTIPDSVNPLLSELALLLGADLVIEEEVFVIQ